MTTQDNDRAKDQARAQYEYIAALMAAQQLDWDRLEELRDLFAEHEELEDGGINPEPFSADYPDEADELDELEEIAGEWADVEDVQRELDEHPLCIEYRSGWNTSAEDLQAEEFCILLCTGGPAVRIVGEIGEHGQPCRAWIEYQDWGTAWTQYFGADQETLVDYATAFVCV